MNVLYVAPRYHTNQIPIMRGWLQSGHQVVFVSQFAGETEDYTVLQPQIVGYSKIFEKWMMLYRRLVCKNEKSPTKEFNFRTKFGFPPLTFPSKIIRDFAPDLVILRERAVYNIPFYQICKKKKIPCILYNQSPLWENKQLKKSLKKRIFFRMLPQKRMTPVFGLQKEENVSDINAAYIPFVTEPHFSPDEKPHFLNNKIQLLCVGRYEERKNLMLLVKVFSDLVSRYAIHLTIIGEMADDGQKEYYNNLKKFIEKEQLMEQVTLLNNYPLERMYEEYQRADLFVLPSTNERASISQLEAMSCSLPVVCSNTNGSACYVEDGINGKLFADNNENDLAEKLEWFLADRERILKAGQKSYQAVCTNYQFQNYYEGILRLLRSI